MLILNDYFKNTGSMKHSYKISFLLVLFLNITHSFSQQRTLSFNLLSAKDGLSQNGVMAIHKDSEGYMWFGTRDGLNRYDGYRFKIYRHDDITTSSISNNFINTITEDKNGILWIGTSNGLNSFNKSTQKFTSYQNDKTDNSSISNNHVQTILFCKNGDMWVGTENGLNYKPKGTKKFLRFFNIVHNKTSLSDNNIQAIYEDHKGDIWIGTEAGGLNKFNKKTNQFSIFKHDPSKPNSISSNSVGTITEDKKHQLWIGTDDNGISILDKKGNFSYIKQNKNNKNSISNNRIRDIIFDEVGNVWIGTYNGLNYYNQKNNSFEVYKNTTKNLKSISHNSIRSLLLDNDGFLWAGTYFGGLNLLNLKSKLFSHFQHNPNNHKSLSYNVVGPILEDSNKNLWIGTEGGGLNYFNYKKQEFQRISSVYGSKIIGKTIKSLLLDKDQNLWIGTHLEGLYHLNFKTHTIKHFLNDKKDPNSLINNSITSILEDHSGKIWIGTEAGLNLFHPGSNNIERVNLNTKQSPITYILEDHNKYIWIGTKLDGLMLLENGTIKQYIHDNNNPNSISHNSIYYLFEDSKNHLWIGTYGGGLNLFNQKTGNFTKFRMRDGLVNDIVYSIEEDNNYNLWISAPNGLSKLEVGTGVFKLYTPNNGLPIEEFNLKSSLHHSSGQLFFGGFNGLLSFNSEKIQDSKVTPEVRLTDLKFQNKSVSPLDDTNLLTKPINNTETITFSHNQNIFTIDYLALNYAQLGQNQYAYMLEGLENKWNYVRNKRSATYTNLEPGSYTFKVKAANSDGVWNEKMSTIKIIKLPPYWKTYWTYSIYLILLITVFVFIRKYILIKFNLENNLKLEKLEKQQLEELTQLKLKFFTNISHDFRTPLTLIHGPLQELIESFKNQESHGHLSLIRKNVNFMLRLINQLMDFRKLQTSTLSLKLVHEPIAPFIKEVMYSFQEQAKTHGIKFIFISRIPEGNIYYQVKG